MMASATQRIQPRPPSASLTLPSAQPLYLAKGARIPQPTSMPRFIDSVTGKPMITPWPMYESEGEKLRARPQVNEARAASQILKDARPEVVARQVAAKDVKDGHRKDDGEKQTRELRKRGFTARLVRVRGWVQRLPTDCEARAGRKAEAKGSPARVAHALEFDALLFVGKLVDVEGVVVVVRVVLAVMHGEGPVAPALARRGRS